MKKYEEPAMKLEIIEVEDVITTSTCPGENPCPVDGGEV